MYTTPTRELQNASAGAIFPFLRHLRRQENRDCTFENLSFIEVKRWVMTNLQNLTGNDDAKSRKTTFQNSTKKISFFLTFFRVKTLQASSSCVGVVTISRKGPKNADNFTVVF